MGRPGTHNEEKTLATMQDNVAVLKKKIESNVYIVDEADIRNARAIIDLYANYPKHYVKMMLSEKHKDIYRPLVEWVYGKTAFLKDGDGFKYDLQTRLNWLFNGKSLSTKCAAGCGRTPALNRSLRMNDPFPEYCCTKCSTNAAATVEKARMTRYAANGGKWESDDTRQKIDATVQAKLDEDPDWYRKRTAKCEATKVRNGHGPKWNNRDKMRETVAAHIDDDPAYYDKIAEKSRATKTARHGDPNWVNPAKARETNMARRGFEYATRDPLVKAKSKNTFRRNHPGLTSSFQLPGVYEKAIAAWQEKYEVDRPLKSAIVQKKCDDTRERRYGNKCIFGVKEFQIRIRKRRLELYGSEFFHGVRYKYDGQCFDSSWELAMWIFCSDYGIPIKREPCMFDYIKDGTPSKYIPDFEIAGQLVEIKGDQFYSEEIGGWVNPWNKKPMLEKFLCAVEHGVAILYYSDIKPILDYIDKTYGKKYLKQFKTK